MRVARVNGEFVINPLRSELEEADMDIMVVEPFMHWPLVEGEMQESSGRKERWSTPLKRHTKHQGPVRSSERGYKKAGTFGNKREYSHETHDDALRGRIQDEMYPKFAEAGKTGATKEEQTRFSELKEASSWPP